MGLSRLVVAMTGGVVVVVVSLSTTQKAFTSLGWPLASALVDWNLFGLLLRRQICQTIGCVSLSIVPGGANLQMVSPFR
jgi:hypothetical protein